MRVMSKAVHRVAKDKGVRDAVRKLIDCEATTSKTVELADHTVVKITAVGEVRERDRSDPKNSGEHSSVR